MRIFDKALEFGEKALTWALGAGAVAIAVGAATTAAIAAGGPPIMFAMLGIPLGAVVSSRLNFLKRSSKEKNLLNFYRDEAAALLEVDPEAVTISNLRQLAEGNPKLGFPANPGLQSELDAYDKELNYDLISTAAGAAITGVLMVSLGGAGLQALNDSLINSGGPLESAVDWIRNSAPVALKFTGATLVAGLVNAATKFSVRGLLQDVNEVKSERVTTAHEAVKDLDLEIKRGNAVTPMQVFGAMVAANTQLAQEVQRQFGAHYEDLPASAQEEAIQQFAHVEQINQLARDVSGRNIRPQSLIFLALGQEKAVIRKEGIQPTYQEEMRAKLRQTVRGITQPVSSFARDTQQAVFARGQQRLANPEVGSMMPTRSHVAGVVTPDPQVIGRYAPPQTAQTPPQSFVQREMARREEAQLADTTLAPIG